jgi:hypothetical protein
MGGYAPRKLLCAVSDNDPWYGVDKGEGEDGDEKDDDGGDDEDDNNTGVHIDDLAGWF